MGRSFKQILWMNFSMAVGTYTGFRVSDFFFWSDDIKYRIWEESEDNFWENYSKPINLKPLVKFDSVINPGQVYYSYLPPFGMYIEKSYYERHKMF